ncbi:MAG: galactokinase [Polyangia bacterium]
MIDPKIVQAAFTAEHGEPGRLFYAPGRVNLIGEHTDYNDGFVLPMAIDRGTWVAGRVRRDRKVRVRSANIEGAIELDLDLAGPRRRGTWQDYIEGVAQALGAQRLVGADLFLNGDVPAGAGLSSSASVEVAVGLALLGLAGVAKLDGTGLVDTKLGTEIALAAQRAEHDYVGTKCGIMDQLVAALGREDHALFIDCRSVEATPVPLALPDAVVLICDSKVKHSLASSAYNDRRKACEDAVALLATTLPGIRSLRDVSSADFATHAAALPDELRRRARHVVGEIERTVAAADALRRGDLVTMGAHMNASHASLRDDYAVSCEELDVLCDIAQRQDGVFGARMTGGGFGGCTVNIVAERALEHTKRALVDGYQARFGKAPDLFVSRAQAGARELLS